jgi:hypothetical protein
MKVKVGDKIYDGKNEPVMVILSERDKKNIANMPPDATKYCVFPDEGSPEDAEVWMGGMQKVWVTYTKGGADIDKIFSDEDAATRYMMDELDPLGRGGEALRKEAALHLDERDVTEEY